MTDAGQAPPSTKVAVVLTAIQTETEAVLRHLVNPTIRRVVDTWFHVGRYGPWAVAVAEVGPGNAPAATIAVRAFTYFKPEIAAFVGIAGGLKDVALGDVVVATKVYGYESGKETPEGFRVRPDVQTSHHELQQRARVIRLNAVWHGRLDPVLGSGRKPNVHVGAIAAGEALVADNAGRIATHLRQHYSDALAVEMEGRGFLEAAHTDSGCRAVVVRGISDLLVGKAETDRLGWQQRAADSAATFFFEMLSLEADSQSDGVAVQQPQRVPASSHLTDETLKVWHDAAHAKYLQEIKMRHADRTLVDRHFQFSYAVERSDGATLDPASLERVLYELTFEVRKLVYTGWSMFFIFNRQELSPYFAVDQNSGQGEDDFLECSILEDSQTGGNDFWRVSRDGLATLLRGYFEDREDASAHLGTTPASFFSPNWMVRDVAEFVRHARVHAEHFNDATAVGFRCTWRGLNGRVLADPRGRWSQGQYRFDQGADQRNSSGKWPINVLRDNWPEIVSTLVAPVMRAARCGHVVTPQWIVGQQGNWRLG